MADTASNEYAQGALRDLADQFEEAAAEMESDRAAATAPLHRQSTGD